LRLRARAKLSHRAQARAARRGADWQTQASCELRYLAALRDCLAVALPGADAAARNMVCPALAKVEQQLCELRDELIRNAP
jgi:hypothetical protein